MQFQTPRPKNDDERILPLINVVFLLLIFFMLAGKLAASDPFEIAPPQSASESSIGAEVLLVQVGAEGQLALEGEILTKSDLQTAVTERMSTDPNTPIQLKADAAAKATEVVAVMQLLRAAGVERLRLLTQPASAPPSARESR
ncbi:MAG: ExbD/TolR family protein [Kiloniellales bacterium]